MYLSVQHAARRLGVSPHTVRRWTESGLLPCTRTAGGHRRIKQEDVDELARLIGGHNHLTTRLERERELDLLTEAVETLARPNERRTVQECLAHHTAAVLECSAVYIWGLDEGSGSAVLLAAHSSGRRRHCAGTFLTARSPAARQALRTREAVAVHVDDVAGEADDAAVLRRDGDASLLMVPAVAGGETLGLVEVRDRRERVYAQHEVRLALALAALAAAAAAGDRERASATRRRTEQEELREAVRRVAAGHGEVHGSSARETLEAAARLATGALGGLACVAACGAETAGAAAAASSGVPAAGGAHVLAAAAGEDPGRVVLTLTLAAPPPPGLAELLELIAGLARAALDRIPSGAGR